MRKITGVLLWDAVLGKACDLVCGVVALPRNQCSDWFSPVIRGKKDERKKSRRETRFSRASPSSVISERASRGSQLDLVQSPGRPHGICRPWPLPDVGVIGALILLEGSSLAWEETHSGPLFTARKRQSPAWT